MTITNPILPGFHPDPSICRVDDTYYIAVSTFEWYPGVLIYQSTNLRDWALISRPLDRHTQLFMAGNPPSGGIWAPCLSYADDQFWLVYTDVKSWAGSPPEYSNGFKDCHNYIVTSKTIEGPWSDRVFINSSGFDPSLFHDDDGKKWFVNMRWDYRPWTNSFGGIVLQEYDPETQRLVGPRKSIFEGTSLALTEAPHLYKRKDWYYLMTAEGGTSYAHGVTLARSREIDGPYQVHPRNPLVTSVKDINGLGGALNVHGLNKPGALDPFLYPGLQKAGHGSMAPVEDTEWVLAHLTGRPLAGTYRCPLGRETAIQRLEWRDDDWPWPVQQGPQGEVEFYSPDLESSSAPAPLREWRDDFDSPTWKPELQTLRVGVDQRFSLSSRPGWLALQGAESPTSTFTQTILCRRVQHFNFSAETLMDFDPEDFQQFAGLLVRYDERSQYLLRVQGNEGSTPSLGLLCYAGGRIDMPLGTREATLETGPVKLAVTMKGTTIQFLYAQGSESLKPIGPELDSSILSDECAQPMGFTGMFVGLGSFDVSGRKKWAYFDYLSYKV